MFTGLIEDLGRVEKIVPAGAGMSLTIRTALPLDEVKVGDSIAVNGVCLTAERFGSGTFVAVAARETMERTTFRSARAGFPVHLERALRLGDRLDGHLVQGHVDGVGEVLSSVRMQESWVLWIQCPPGLEGLIASKGSIAVDGVSLTVNEVEGRRFRLNIVPHSQRATHLVDRVGGDSVNLEVDVLARYVQRLLAVESAPDLLTTMRANGW